MPESSPPPAAPLVSVVVPTFDRAYCLEATLRSALAQSHAALELVVVDDGSTDGTEALVRALQEADRRVRYHRQDNRGVAAARNAGLRLAGGEYVAFLDSDDLWRPWKLELQLLALRRVPEAGMVWTDMEAIDPDGRVLFERYLRRMYSAYRLYPPERLFARHLEPEQWLPPGSGLPPAHLHAGDVYSAMIMGNLVHTSTVLLRRDWALRAGGFPEENRSGEDYDFHLRTCELGPVAFIDLPTTSYRRGLADRLTRPELEFELARNALRTLEGALARDAGRIATPRRMIRAARAEANRWVGGIHFGAGRFREATPYLAASLRQVPGQPMVLAQWLVSRLPPAVARRVVSLRRRIVGRAG
jgi:GT2 family glycosyltransferase